MSLRAKMVFPPFELRNEQVQVTIAPKNWYDRGYSRWETSLNVLSPSNPVLPHAPKPTIKTAELYCVQIELLDASQSNIIVARGCAVFGPHSRKHVKVELLPDRGISQSRTTVLTRVAVWPSRPDAMASTSEAPTLEAEALVLPGSTPLLQMRATRAIHFGNNKQRQRDRNLLNQAKVLLADDTGSQIKATTRSKLIRLQERLCGLAHDIQTGRLLYGNDLDVEIVATVTKLTTNQMLQRVTGLPSYAAPTSGTNTSLWASSTLSVTSTDTLAPPPDNLPLPITTTAVLVSQPFAGSMLPPHLMTASSAVSMATPGPAPKRTKFQTTSAVITPSQTAGPSQHLVQRALAQSQPRSQSMAQPMPYNPLAFGLGATGGFPSPMGMPMLGFPGNNPSTFPWPSNTAMPSMAHAMAIQNAFMAAVSSQLAGHSRVGMPSMLMAAPQAASPLMLQAHQYSRQTTPMMQSAQPSLPSTTALPSNSALPVQEQPPQHSQITSKPKLPLTLATTATVPRHKSPATATELQSSTPPPNLPIALATAVAARPSSQSLPLTLTTLPTPIPTLVTSTLASAAPQQLPTPTPTLVTSALVASSTAATQQLPTPVPTLVTSGTLAAS
eukprot:m.129872 g.129872  ORF g.129872 m.129872 type:complete len:613 (-) comp15860_c0_seq3:1448-3286(-)